MLNSFAFPGELCLTWDACYPEYCQKYAKPEDVGASPEEQSSDEELSDAEYDSDDEAMAGPVDP